MKFLVYVFNIKYSGITATQKTIGQKSCWDDPWLKWDSASCGLITGSANGDNTATTDTVVDRKFLQDVLPTEGTVEVELDYEDPLEIYEAAKAELEKRNNHIVLDFKCTYKKLD